MNVAVIFYSLYGDTAALAAAVAQGAEQAGAEVRLRRVAEILPDHWTMKSEKIRATRERLASIPLARVEDLAWADGAAFGSPTRYGALSAQLVRFLGGVRHLSGELAGKAAAVFCAPSASQGAQRSALLSMTIPLLRCGFLVQAPTRAEIETMSAAAGPRDSTPPAIGPAAAREPAEPDLSRARALGRRLALAGAPRR